MTEHVFSLSLGSLPDQFSVTLLLGLLKSFSFKFFFCTTFYFFLNVSSKFFMLNTSILENEIEFKKGKWIHLWFKKSLNRIKIYNVPTEKQYVDKKRITCLKETTEILFKSKKWESIFIFSHLITCSLYLVRTYKSGDFVNIL